MWYCMDEEGAEMDTDRAASDSTDAPFHPKPRHDVSRIEILDAGIIRSDPETAHNRAGDPGYALRIPESCLACEAKALSEAALEEISKEIADGR